jgi:predicted metalloprotease with PDZ domain
MPVWSPGYYAVLDFPGNVQQFRAGYGDGRAVHF